MPSLNAHIQRASPLLYVVVPCYEESGYGKGCLHITAPQLLAEIQHLAEVGKIAGESRILFVDDGSADDTWQAITQLAKQDEHYCGIKLSRNRGHQNALLAGLMECRDKCDISISIDCDGQDDIAAMEAMVDCYLEGCDVVYGVRSKRDSDTFFKRFSAELFYKMMSRMGVETVFNHADYRLLSARVLDELSEYQEVNLFLRGLVPLIGFKSATVAYERASRVAGQSHYPLKRMLGLAADGITSLSTGPLRLAAGLGVAFSALGLVGVVWALASVAAGQAVSGWASTLCVISLIGGIQLLCLGTIGVYVGKIYLEVKHRPRFIVAERTEGNGP